MDTDPTRLLDVAVLGRVELRVDGQLVRIGRAKSAELVVYLALHPAGADGDELWEALWPERPVRRYMLYTAVSVARRSLRAYAGESVQVCDARGGKLYQLAAPVSLDWHRFMRLVGDGADQEGLAAALDLVRGVPFTSSRSASYDWARGDRTEMESTIGFVAERLGLRRLEQGDALGARQAARHGLVGAPYDERLYRVLIQAAQAVDHPGGVEAVRQELAWTMGVAANEVV